MRKINKQLRQGDVLLTPVKVTLAGYRAIEHSGRIILAEGEATGHAHTIEAPPSHVEHFTHEQQTYLVVHEPVELTHQEHGAIVVEPGTYEVRRQVESWMDEVRQVAD